jgi:hypothetical protein
MTKLGCGGLTEEIGTREIRQNISDLEQFETGRDAKDHQ